MNVNAFEMSNTFKTTHTHTFELVDEMQKEEDEKEEGNMHHIITFFLHPIHPQRDKACLQNPK